MSVSTPEMNHCGGGSSIACQNANYPIHFSDIFGGNPHMLGCKRPSDLKTAYNDPISGEMMLCGCLNTFLAISNFFDSYRTLARPRKLDKTPKIGTFCNFPVTIAFWGSQNQVKKCL